MTAPSVDIEAAHAISLASDCLADVPVIVLGSGSSCAYGIRGMSPLADFLIANVTPDSADAKSWGDFADQLRKNKDLEEALQRVSVSDALLKQIVMQTQRMICEDEIALYHQIVTNQLSPSLSGLYKYLFQTTHRVLNVVTTNYDRIAEFAAYHAKVRCNTGFSDGAIRHFSCDKSDPAHYVRQSRFRCVDIWKVHGSVDWFCDSSNRPVGLLDGPMLPSTFSPLIVTPGITKYTITHQEPFRSVIACADQALASARSFLCVGYGFSDAHIEPKLIQRSEDMCSPVVILARTLRPGAKLFLERHMHSKVVAFEKEGSGTRVYTSRMTAGVLIENETLWSLDGLMDKLGITV